MSLQDPSEPADADDAGALLGWCNGPSRIPPPPADADNADDACAIVPLTLLLGWFWTCVVSEEKVSLSTSWKKA